MPWRTTVPLVETLNGIEDNLDLYVGAVCFSGFCGVNEITETLKSLSQS